eukprot:evm.model.scf_965EXC.5 EVM.evm.TU.scf_965EXC.5   scf_965EXC:54008-57325(-)
MGSQASASPRTMASTTGGDTPFGDWRRGQSVSTDTAGEGFQPFLQSGSFDDSAESQIGADLSRDDVSFASAGDSANSTLGPGLWLAEWRLRKALSAEDMFEDLFVELTLTAAWCYARAGRIRTSVILRVDVAPLLLRHGMVAQAQQLYRLKCEMYAKEGWPVLMEDVLPCYAASLRASDPAGLMAVCLTMLALPAGLVGQEDRVQLQEEFEECGRILEDRGAKSLVALPALQISPLKLGCSSFFGDVDDNAEPVLVPPACAASGSGEGVHSRGALLAHAGDIVELDVEVRSTLPRPLKVTNASLTLLLVGGRALETEMGALLAVARLHCLFWCCPCMIRNVIVNMASSFELSCAF